jgi:hypothetical protein
MQRIELDRIREELRQELGRRRVVAEGLPAVFGEAQTQILSDLVEEAKNSPPASPEERAQLAKRLLEGMAYCSRLCEWL